MIKIITGIKLRLDPKLKLLNCTENLISSKANKGMVKFVNNMLVMTKRIIFTLYYRGDGATKSSDILEEFRKNLKLTIKFMSENAVFLNITLDVSMKDLLLRSYKLLGNLIRNRPSLYSYIMKYKGNLPHSYEQERNINFRKYFESFKIYNRLNPQQTRREMLRRDEYHEMSAKTYNVNPEVKETIKTLRRRKGILRKAQRDLLHTYDKNLVNINNGFPPLSS